MSCFSAFSEKNHPVRKFICMIRNQPSITETKQHLPERKSQKDEIFKHAPAKKKLGTEKFQNKKNPKALLFTGVSGVPFTNIF